MTQPCELCGDKVLIVKFGTKTVILDYASRRHIFELSDSSVELVACRVDAQELYVAHEVVCCGEKRGGR